MQIHSSAFPVQPSFRSIWKRKDCEEQQFQVNQKMTSKVYHYHILVFFSYFSLTRNWHDWVVVPVVLVNLLKFNLISMGRSLGLQLGHIFLKGHVFAKSQTQRETTIVFTCFVLHHQRWVPWDSPFANSSQMILSCHLDDLRNLLQDVKRYKLGDPRSFHYLNQTNCYEVANVDDAREYLETRNAMDVVGIGPEEQVCAQNTEAIGKIILCT